MQYFRPKIEHFMNMSTELCPLSKEFDDINVRRKASLNTLERVSFDVDVDLRCGWLLLLGHDFNIELVFFLEYGKRFVLINNVDEFISLFEVSIAELYKVHDGVLMFDSGVIKIKQDEFNMHWMIITELVSGVCFNPDAVRGLACRVVLSETQFYALRQVLNNLVKKARCEINYLMSTYNVVLREILVQTRNNICSDCFGFMRSEPGEFSCAKGDTNCIAKALYLGLQKKRITNRKQCLEFVFENISRIFPTIARRLKKEMHNEELMFKYSLEGSLEYVSYNNGKDLKNPLANTMPI
jgi:hypothetical protein